MTDPITTHTNAPKTGLVTHHKVFNVGACGVFAVQPGIDLKDAMNALGILLETARGTADMVASNLEDAAGHTPPDAPWAPVVLIEMAQALNDSIFAAYCELGKAPPKAETPEPAVEPTVEAREATIDAGWRAMAASMPNRPRNGAAVANVSVTG